MPHAQSPIPYAQSPIIINFFNRNKNFQNNCTIVISNKSFLSRIF
ncbi:MAG: hypothetical protein AAF630_04700 [Cyanobacteria bacterium P01_C01_bin.38]